MDSLLLRPGEAAKLLAMSRTTLYALLATGELESIKIGASRLIPVDAVHRLVADRRAGSAEYLSRPAP